MLLLVVSYTWVFTELLCCREENLFNSTRKKILSQNKYILVFRGNPNWESCSEKISFFPYFIHCSYCNLFSRHFPFWENLFFESYYERFPFLNNVKSDIWKWMLLRKCFGNAFVFCWIFLKMSGFDNDMFNAKFVESFKRISKRFFSKI